MPTRSGKEYLNPFELKNQPFNLILLPKKTYDNKIDFDKSFKEWRKNKISLGYGMFKYRSK